MWLTFKNKFFIQFWSPFAAVIAAGILSTYFFGLTGSLWAVTGEFTRWGGHIMQWFGAEPETWQYFKIIGLEGTPLDRVGGVMIIGMFGGCLAAVLWANNMKLRMPSSKKRIGQALIGGMIAGFGARLAMGCNLAAFFTGIPQFTLHAWLFAFAAAAGTYIGAKITLLPFFRSSATVKPGGLKKVIKPNPNQVQNRFRLGWVVFAAIVAGSFYIMSSSTKLGFAMLMGIVFGLLIERAQICFTSAFRDMWITGRTHMAKAIILGMAVSVIGIYSYVQLGMTPKTLWAGPNALIGGLLFGIGIVIAGGCETGWMYRALEGQIHFWWVGIGNIIGATILAYYWDVFSAPLATNWDKVNLLDVFGPLGGLGVTYLLLALSFGLILLWEKHFFKKQRSLKNAKLSPVVSQPDVVIAMAKTL
ncbi:selenium metabolism membrane protein YedE/FdhT [Shewanella gelidimarina]|uniref:selenium metabolism membrane protein YedE/FdhT n=1 Tax=Shewanella gelidimarina TaxID=56813 RepID=UPI00200FB84C|nr:selenium metabolism membrane protein YedE/FdhT [Shewanella gelidimarina]MCL1056645.1 selenium metabolism membrane protein YedE/FdhT [Shewanella gelidimarina]